MPSKTLLVIGLDGATFDEAYARQGYTGDRLRAALCDGMLTFLLAGRETVAAALSWSWHFLSRSPAVEQRLRQEIAAVLGGRSPTAADLPNLPYARQVVAEALRCRPPAWALARRALQPIRGDGLRLERGDVVLISQYALHHSPSAFPDPQRFAPDRWAPGAAPPPPGAYLPFGAGPRRCIGEPLAWAECVLALATIIQRRRLIAPSDDPVDLAGGTSLLRRAADGQRGRLWGPVCGVWGKKKPPKKHPHQNTRFETSSDGTKPMMHIPQMQPWLGEEEQAAAAAAVASGWISEGPQSARFAEGLNALIGAPYGVFAPNGTLALYLALLAAGIGPGDEVLVPDSTFIASANAVIFAGATPVFVDVDRETFQIDPAACAARIGPRTRAIMPVALFGLTPPMDALLSLARAHGLLMIEDAAQAIGVRYRGRHAGSFGELGCFSFFADKTLTTGEGGYVVCHDPATHERLCLLRNQGRISRGSFLHPALGTNLRITDIQAAIGLVQLARLAAIVARKRAILDWYQQGLAGLAEVRLLTAPPDVEAVPFRAVLLCPDADALLAHLQANGIQPRGFFYPLHRQPCFAHLTQPADAHYPNAIYGYEHGVLLPCYPELSETQVAYICATIRGMYRG